MTIATLLDMASSGHPDRVFLGSRSGGLTVAEIADRASRGATILRGTSAAHVALVGTNGPAFPTLVYAAALAGVPIAPLSYRLSAEQLSRLLDTLERPVVIADRAYLEAVGSREVISTDEWLAEIRTAPPAE